MIRCSLEMDQLFDYLKQRLAHHREVHFDALREKNAAERLRCKRAVAAGEHPGPPNLVPETICQATFGPIIKAACEDAFSTDRLILATWLVGASFGTRQDMHQCKVQLTSTSDRRIEIGRRNKELVEQLSSHPGMEDTALRLAVEELWDPEWYCPGKVVVKLAPTGKCRTTGAFFAPRVVCWATLLRRENVPA